MPVKSSFVLAKPSTNRLFEWCNTPFLTGIGRVSPEPLVVKELFWMTGNTSFLKSTCIMDITLYS